MWIWKGEEKGLVEKGSCLGCVWNWSGTGVDERKKEREERYKSEDG